MLQKAFFKGLSHRDDIEIPQSYKDALDQVIENKDIKNIALTGSYGSGKSSILCSYFNKKVHWCSMVRVLLWQFKVQEKAHFISLASFNNDSTLESKNGESLESKSLRELEQALLQQFFYSLDANKLKYSHIKRILHPAKLLPFLKIVFLSCAILITFIYFITYNSIQKISPSFFSLFIIIKDIITECYDNLITSIITSIIMIIAFFIGVMIAYRYSKRFKINKIALVGVSAEYNKQDTNLLNTYLDELIYFFRRHKGYNIFVFEDMDRFDNPNIFIKLREINKAVNDYFLFNTTFCTPRVIKFIYVLRDNIFKQPEERTKFFDAIISIVPFVNYGQSSYGRLKEVFNINKNDDNPKLELLEGISMYLNDYRLMLSIYNDYNIYKGVLNLPEDAFSKKKLLAIMIYKNCHPDDFELLHHKKGLLCEILGDIAIQYEIDECQKELDEIIKELPIEHDKLKDTLIEWLDKQNITSINEKSTKEYSLDELVEHINKTADESHFKHNFGNNYVNYSNKSSKIHNLELEIMKLKNISFGIYNISTPNHLMEKFKMMHRYRDKKFNPPENQILDFLLYNGYIDSDYYLYIDIFSENDFTQNDRDFIHKAKYEYNRENLYNLPIDNIKLVIDHLGSVKFRKEIENIYVLQYLLDTNNNYEISLYVDRDFRKYFLEYSPINYKQKLVDYIIANNKLEPNWTDIGLLISKAIYSNRVAVGQIEYIQFNYWQDIVSIRNYLKIHVDEILKSENNGMNTYYKLIVMNYIRLNNAMDNETYKKFVNENPSISINEYLNKDKLCILLNSHDNGTGGIKCAERVWGKETVQKYCKSITSKDLQDKNIGYTIVVHFVNEARLELLKSKRNPFDYFQQDVLSNSNI